MTAGPAPRSASHRLTRITIVAATSRADLVVPADEPIGLLLPDLVRVIGGPPPAGNPRRLELSLTDGTELSTEQSLAAAGVVDGTVLRLNESSQAPPPAVVYDLVDQVEDDHAARRGRWTPAVQNVAASLGVGFALAGLALSVSGHVPAPLLIGASVLVLLAGVGVCFSSVGRLGFGIAVGGAGAAGFSIMAAGPSFGLTLWCWLLVLAVVLFGYGIAFHRVRWALLGSATLAIFLLLWLAVAVLPWEWSGRGGVMVVLSLLAIGLLPRLMIMAAGLTRLDDDRVDGRPVSRPSVASAIDTAHRGYAVCLMVTALSAAAGGVWAATSPNPFLVLLAIAAALILVLRTRACVLIIESASLLIAAAMIVLAVLLSWPLLHADLWWLAPIVAVLVGSFAFVIMGQDQASSYEHARGRRVADVVELVAAIALIPLLIAGVGVYGRLLGA